MPRVPTKTEQSVSLQGVSSVFQRERRPADFVTPSDIQDLELAQFGQTISKAGESAADTLLGIQLRHDETNFDQARVDYDERVNQVLYGDGSAENKGFYGTKGKNSLDAGVPTRDALDKIRKDITENADSRIQGRLDLSFKTTGLKHLANISKHVSSQRDVYDQQLSDARKETLANDAALGYNDPAAIQSALSGSRIMVLKDAARLGYAPEVTNAELEAASDNVIVKSVTAAIKDGNFANAESIVKQFGGQLSGPVKAEVNRSIQKAVQLREIQAMSDRIMAANGVSEADRLTEARKAKDPAVRKAVVNDVKRRMKELNTAQKAATQKAEAAASTALIEGGQSFAQFGAENPELFDMITNDPETFNRLQKLSDNMAEGRIFSRTSDGKTLATFRRKEPEDLAVMTDDELNLHRQNMTNEEWDSLQVMVNGAREKARRTRESSETFRRGDQFLENYAPKGFGYDKKIRSDDDRDAIAATRNDMAAFIAGFTDRGKTPTNPELIAKVREIYTPFTDGGIGGTGFFEETATFAEVRALPVAQQHRFVPDLDKMNPDRVTAIRKTLKGVGIKGTDEQVQQAVKSRLLGNAHTVPLDQIDAATIKKVGTFLEERGVVATPEVVEQWVGAAAIQDRVKQRDILGSAEPSTIPIEPGVTPGVPPVTAPPIEEPVETPVAPEPAATEPAKPVAQTTTKKTKFSTKNVTSFSGPKADETDVPAVEITPSKIKIGSAKASGAPKMPNNTEKLPEFSAIVSAVEQQESRGKPRAKSGAGALGRLQTMPGTLKSPGFGVKAAKDNSDREKTRVGVDFLKAMMIRYNDNLDQALMAFNWGPGNVDRWFKGGKKKFVPSETVSYVITVRERLGLKPSKDFGAVTGELGV